jgi:hypothetical protein
MAASPWQCDDALGCRLWIHGHANLLGQNNALLAQAALHNQ